MRVRDICTRQAVWIGPAASVREAAQLMRKRHVGALVVAEQPNGERLPVGMLTDRDIVIEVVASGCDALGMRVGDIMARDVATCTEEEFLLDAVERMRVRGVRRLPVLNARGGLAGLLSVNDVYGALGVHMQELSRALTRGQAREMELRT